MWWVIFVIFSIIAAYIFFSPSEPLWATEPCENCSSEHVQWREGEDNSCTAEALFECKECSHLEYRGGPTSEFAMMRAHGKQL